MNAHSIDRLTLREKIKEAGILLRELVEHLDHGFIPKAHDLRQLVRPVDRGADVVEDAAVRNDSARLLESDQYTEKLYGDLGVYFASIAEESRQIVEQG